MQNPCHNWNVNEEQEYTMKQPQGIHMSSVINSAWPHHICIHPSSVKFWYLRIGFGFLSIKSIFMSFYGNDQINPLFQQKAMRGLFSTLFNSSRLLDFAILFSFFFVSSVSLKLNGLGINEGCTYLIPGWALQGLEIHMEGRWPYMYTHNCQSLD